jgi:hypothetical protein
VIEWPITTRKGVGSNPAWIAFYFFGKAKIRFYIKIFKMRILGDIHTNLPREIRKIAD